MAWRTAESVVSVEEVVNLMDEPKLAKLQKVDEEKVYKSIGRMLARMVVELHIADGLSTANIRNIAKRLTTDNEIRWWLTLADVDLLCRRIVSGDFGKFYGHFGEAEFNECFKKYCNERTDLHRIQNDKVVTPDASVLQEVGYGLDKDGRLVVPDAVQEKKLPPPLYIYDNEGHRRENPEAWKKVRKEDTEKQDRVLAFAKILMAEDKTLDIKDAIERAANSMNNNPQNQ